MENTNTRNILNIIEQEQFYKILEDYSEKDKFTILNLVNTFNNTDRKFSNFSDATIAKYNLDTKLSKKEIFRAVSDIFTYYDSFMPVEFAKHPELSVICDKCGNIYSMNRRMLSFNKDNKGYLNVSCKLSNGKSKSLKVHRVMCFSWLSDGKPLDSFKDLQVNHKDGNKENNSIDNLEWCTNLENIRHSWETGLRTVDCYIGQNTGEKNGRSKLSNDIARQIYDDYLLIRSEFIASKSLEYSVSEDAINFTLDNVDDHSVDRYKIEKSVRTNSPNKTYYTKMVWNTRNSGSSAIRGEFIDLIRAFKVSKSKKYNVIPHTIGSITSQRNWNNI